MIHSMTAFARAETQITQGQLIWELRSVNHRYLDISLRLPEDFRALETPLREQIQSRLTRGKVDATLKWIPCKTTLSAVQLNHEFVEQTHKAVTVLSGYFPQISPINPLEFLKMPGALIPTEIPLEPVTEAALSLLGTGLESLVESRQTEGARLGEMIQERADTIAELILTVATQRPEVLSKLREKLIRRLEEIRKEIEVDSHRLEQEMVFAAQRLDVEEELDRLRSHLQELNKVLAADEPVGRKLDFLMQEFNREANTLSSKSSDAITTRCAVEMKVLIEQMREQIQNIE